MRKIFTLALLGIAGSAFSQIVYPGTPTTGTVETVFDYSVSKCNTIDIPDAPARAFRDASGKINLIASHYTTWRMTGSTFNSLTTESGSWHHIQPMVLPYMPSCMTSMYLAEMPIPAGTMPLPMYLQWIVEKPIRILPLLVI